MNGSTQLSVNVNKIALVRNSRGMDYPNLVQFSRDLLECGAHGITVHPRPDQRHVRYDDLAPLKKLCDEYNVELNVEGYPSEEFISEVLAVRPAQCTLVPDEPGALTSDAGWDCEKNVSQLQSVVSRLQEAGVRVSLFLDPNPEMVAHAAATGADTIELYTQEYAEAFGRDDFAEVFAKYQATGKEAVAQGLLVNAGHDLNQENLATLCKGIPGLAEVSIGHALVGEMLYDGMEKTIKGYLSCLV